VTRGTGALLERAAELVEIEGRMEEAVTGQASLVVIEDPQGVGKTRLVGAARDLARDAGLEP
jgi:hypothetical protein